MFEVRIISAMWRHLANTLHIQPTMPRKRLRRLLGNGRLQTKSACLKHLFLFAIYGNVQNSGRLSTGIRPANSRPTMFNGSNNVNVYTLGHTNG